METSCVEFKCGELFYLQSAVSEFLDFRMLFWGNKIVLLCSPEIIVFVSEVGQTES